MLILNLMNISYWKLIRDSGYLLDNEQPPPVAFIPYGQLHERAPAVHYTVSSDDGPAGCSDYGDISV